MNYLRFIFRVTFCSIWSAYLLSTFLSLQMSHSTRSQLYRLTLNMSVTLSIHQLQRNTTLLWKPLECLSSLWHEHDATRYMTIAHRCVCECLPTASLSSRVAFKSQVMLAICLRFWLKPGNQESVCVTKTYRRPPQCLRRKTGWNKL